MSDEIRMKPYEMPEYFCASCNADLEKQKGYSPTLDYWVCKSCGTMLTNPETDDFDSDIIWFCDGCEDCLNTQEGFSEKYPIWRCQKCGFENVISSEMVYETPELYELDRKNSTRGMSDVDLLRLMSYREVTRLDEARKISMVTDPETGEFFIKKVLEKYSLAPVRELKARPVKGMPRIVDYFEAMNYVTVIEEFISGRTLKKILEERLLSEKEASGIMCALCDIVAQLHGRQPAIIHRDIKPSNVMLTGNDTVYLLDVDAAKGYKQGETMDTVLLGTREYAAPEQYGFGASTIRTDIYALGVLLNVMLTGKYPKEQLASGKMGEVVQKCTRLEPSERYESAAQLKAALERIE